MRRLGAAAVAVVLALGLSARGAERVERDIVRLTGAHLRVDDALFTGGYHNAFEGEVLEPQKGVLKAGPQGVRRTKGVLNGAGSSTSRMTLEFSLDRAPAGAAHLRIAGLDDRADAPCPVAVVLNGRELTPALIFPANQNVRHGLNQRYFVGWEERRVEVPDGVLRKGGNTLTLANTRSIFSTDRWPFVVFDEVVFDLAEAVEMRIERAAFPPLYYGLSEGVEVNAWPAVNQGNRISLVREAALEVNFFATFPREKALGKLGALSNEPTRPRREILLHLATDADVRILNMEGAPLTGKGTPQGLEYTHPIDRIIGYETPHPSQGVRVFLVAGSAFEGKSLTAWYSVDGVDDRKRVYPLRAVALDPIPEREHLDFLLSLWGASAPEEPATLDRYVRLLKSAGFNHQFTGDSPNLNRALKGAGFRVYPRYGWFGRQFKVSDANREFASVDARGEPSTRDFCPLAILAHPDDAEMGKFFERAARLAALPDIDGICVDYETAPVWCWCERCLDEFRRETGIADLRRADVAPDGPHGESYADFGRRLNRRLLTKVKEVMLAQNGALQYHCLASAADLPTYWYDGRKGARHTVAELVKFADAIYASHYCYEMPGGLKSVIPVVETVRQFAVASGREVKANLITPVATTVSEFPRYRGARLRPEMTRLMILLAGVSGAGGISLFRGDCMDGEQYLACRTAISDLVMLRPYLAGPNRTFEVEVTPAAEERPVFDTEIAQNLLSRLVWRPAFSYQYDVVQRLKDKMGRDRAVLLFNYSDAALPFRLKVRGLCDPACTLHDMRTGRELGRFSRIEIESGRPTLTVPARDCLILRVVTVEEEQK